MSYAPHSPEARTLPLSVGGWRRLAYIARLLRTLAMAYGVTTDHAWVGTPLVAVEEPNTLAALLRGLNDILWMP